MEWVWAVGVRCVLVGMLLRNMAQHPHSVSTFLRKSVVFGVCIEIGSFFPQHQVVTLGTSGPTPL